MRGVVTGDAERFEGERPRLIGLAYRLLGSRAEAEDVVQDVWMAWAAADQEGIERPEAWLTTVTTRTALDRLRSARHRREQYVGPWLPEPVVTGPVLATERDPAELAELAESLTLGFLTLLESLEPVERVVLVLAEAYRMPFAEIAPIVGRSAAACRQVASRARRRLHAERPRLAGPSEAASVAARLVAAVGAADMDAVIRLLADDVVLMSDGGPRRHAARRPVVGPQRVSRLLVNLGRRVNEAANVEFVAVNGQPGLVVHLGAEAVIAMEMEIVGDRVARIFAVLNPDKLSRLDEPSQIV